MTIYLPNEPTAFRNSFDNACDRIIASKQNRVFYSLYVTLIEAVQANLVIGPYFHEFEKISQQLRQKFISAALEAIEEEWIFLWKMHPKNWPVRKELIRIKRSITHPNGFTFNLLLQQINFSLTLLRSLPSFCGLLKKIDSFFQSSFARTMCTWKTAPCTNRQLKNLAITNLAPRKKKNLVNCISIIEKTFLHETTASMQNRCFHITEQLASYKRVNLISQASIPGQDIFEKRKNMLAIAELDPLFCWDRMLFLQECWHFEETRSTPKIIKGKWAIVREEVWHSAWDTNDKMVILGAKMNLINGLNTKPGHPSPFTFLNVEHQLNRRDYEGFLQSLKNHIHMQLFKKQDKQTLLHTSQPITTSPSLEQLTKANTDRIERENYIIDHAKKFRIEFPLDTHKNMFNNYKTTCPKNLVYGLTKWKEIIQHHELDPRTDEEKKKKSGRPPKKQGQKTQSKK